MDVSELVMRFDQLSAALSDQMPSDDRLLVEAVERQPLDARRTYGFDDLAPAVKSPLVTIAALPDPRAGIASRRLIAGLCAKNGDYLANRLTEGVQRRTVESLDRLLTWLTAEPPESYRFPDDYFLKDFRFATGMTVPCGAQVVDLAERPGVKTMLALVSKAPGVAWQSAIRPWFKPHTESRYLAEFNEQGWNRCYREIADLLRVLPRVAGMVATSWFYDPAVSTISPRLAYLRRVPIDAGAIAIRHGTTQFDIDSATATSPSRRALHDAGKYVPECWSIVWPRAQILGWAEASRETLE